MENANSAIFSQNSARDRMAHFNVFVVVKRHRDNKGV